MAAWLEQPRSLQSKWVLKCFQACLICRGFGNAAALHCGMQCLWQFDMQCFGHDDALLSLCSAFTCNGHDGTPAEPVVAMCAGWQA